MRILVVNANTSEEMTRDIGEAARRYARADTEIEITRPEWGPRSIEGHYEETVAALATLETIQERVAEFDGVVIGCYGDPALYAAREISPVPVVGTAEASMLMACPVAHKFSVVTVLPRVKPFVEDVIRMHGLEARCASIRTTPLSVLDCERDPSMSLGERAPSAYSASNVSRRYSKNGVPQLNPGVVVKRWSLTSAVYGIISSGRPDSVTQ